MQNEHATSIVLKVVAGEQAGYRGCGEFGSLIRESEHEDTWMSAGSVCTDVAKPAIECDEKSIFVTTCCRDDRIRRSAQAFVLDGFNIMPVLDKDLNCANRKDSRRA